MTLLHIGLGEQLPVFKKKLVDASFREINEGELSADLSNAEALVIGPYENNPVKLVQKINRLDKYISILIFSFPQDFSKAKQAIQFAPFVGKNTLPIAYTASLDLQAAINNASLRTRQRRSFSKINKTPPAATSISSRMVSVENFGVFLEHAPIGAILLDDQSRVVAINNKAKEFFETDEQKIYILEDVFPSLTLHQLKLHIAATSGNNDIADTLSKVVQLHEQFFEVHLSEVKNEDGKLLNILLVNNITAQKKKEAALVESEAMFRFMADAMPQKVWTADDKGYRNFFNQKWIEYTGLSFSELEGWGWSQVIHPDDRDATLTEWQKAIDTGNEFEYENRLRSSDGEYRWHLVRSIARKDASGKILMWIGTNTDIHDQKAFAEALEVRVKERTFELEESNSELEQFVYVSSHDLQEPLRKIRLFSELLKEAYEGDTAAAKKYLEKINATAFRMSTLLKELLNFTQISKQEQFQDTDLNQVISQALIDLEIAITEKGAVIHVDELPVIKAIPVQMHQLFYNLLNNALKFSVPEVSPVIHVKYKIAEPEQVHMHPHLHPGTTYVAFEVRDNGIGFDQSYAQQIFHIFQRLHGRTEYSGTGIGLALCKKVVANHFGAISAVSEKEKGAAFHILLPVE